MATDCLGLADRIASRLCDQALWHEGRAVWLGDEKENIDGSWEVVHQSIGGDVYGGTAGIGIFLSRIWALTASERHRRTAEGAFAFAADWQRRTRAPGNLYSGSAGVAAALAEGAETFGSDLLRREAESIAFDALGHAPDENDLIVGRAGTVVALLAVARRLGLPRLVEAAIEIGDQLVAEAVGEPYPGAGWGSDIDSDSPPLCGLAHGASGAAWALAELSLESGDSRHRATAHAATDYERAWYQPEQGNWPDLREFDRGRLRRGEPPAFPLYWCHGAPGIGLVRLRLFELDGRTIDAVEAEAALQSAELGLAQMASDTSALNLSLCHGLASLVELFHEGARVFDQPQLQELAADSVELAAEVTGSGAGPWPCGVPDGGENPSLMLGLAGIGLMFLRAASPAVEGAGLLYAKAVERKRLIVKLQGPLEREQIGQRATEISKLLPGSRIERISRRGRVLLRLPSEASMSEAVDEVQRLEDVAYAEPDVVDSAADS